MIPVTNDPSVAIGVVAASLDSPTVVSAPMSYELRSYTVFPAYAISLSDFGTTPIPGEIIMTNSFKPVTPSTYNTYTVEETCGNYLYSSFCQLDTNCEFLPKKYIGVMGLLKSTFQLLQLEIGECGTVPTLLPFADDARRSVFALRTSREIIRYKKVQFIHPTTRSS